MMAINPATLAEDSSAETNEKKLTTAIVWSIVSNWSIQGLSSLVTLILAAFLKPADFGLVAMAAIYVAFLEMVIGFGLNAAIIQKKELGADLLSSVFWLILIASTCFTGLSVVLSGWWAMLYHLPQLKLVIVILSFGLPLEGLTTVQQALLQRRMDFRSLAIRDNGALLLGSLIGIGMAVSGFGVWALVVQTLSRRLIGVWLLWSVGRWRPTLRFSLNAVRGVLTYSSKIFLANLAVFIQTQSDALLIGLFYGPAAVGVYRLSDRLVNMALNLLTRSVQAVSLPHFAKLQQDRNQLRRALISLWRKSTILTVPVMFFLCAASDDLMRTIGRQWEMAADVFKILAIVGVAKSVSLFTGSLVQAAGRPGLQALMTWVLGIGIALAFLTVGLITRGQSSYLQVMLMAGSRAGVFVCVYLPVNFMLARFVCGVSAKDLWTATWHSILIGGSIAVIVRSSSFFLQHVVKSPPLIFVLDAAVAIAVWVILVYATDRRARMLTQTALDRSRARWANFWAPRVDERAAPKQAT